MTDDARSEPPRPEAAPDGSLRGGSDAGASGAAAESAGAASAGATGGRALLRLEFTGGDVVEAVPGGLLALVGGHGSGLPELFRSVTDRVVRAHDPRRRGGTAVIGRRRALTPVFDVAENIFLGDPPAVRLGGLRIPFAVDQRRVRRDSDALLAELGADFPSTRRTDTLDEYGRLVVELARAWRTEAAMVVLDEPTAVLDEAQSDQLFSLLRRFTARGVAMVVLTQKPLQALRTADVVVVARAGTVVAREVRPAPGAEAAVGPADTAELEAARRRVLRAMFADPTDDSGGPVGSATPGDLGPGARDAGAAELLRVSGWTVADPLGGERALVQDAGFAVRAGEVLGLAGLERSGGDVLLLSVYGRSAGGEASGAVTAAGERVQTDTIERAIAAGLFLAGSERQRYRVSIIGGISMPVTPSRLRGLGKIGLVSEEPVDRGQPSAGDRVMGAVRSLSREGSEASRILSFLGEFPASERTVLLLVDPFRGMEAAQRAEFARGVAAVRAAGKAVVIADDDLDALRGLADRVIYLSDGRVMGELPATAPADEFAPLLAPQ